MTTTATNETRYVRRVVQLAMPAHDVDRAAAEKLLRASAPDADIVGYVERVPAIGFFPRGHDSLCVTPAVVRDGALGHCEVEGLWNVTHAESGLAVIPASTYDITDLSDALRMLDALTADDMAPGFARPWRDILADTEFRARAVAVIRATAATLDAERRSAWEAA